MVEAPRLSSEQRAAARTTALAARQARAAARAELKSGRLSLIEFLQLAQGDPQLASMRVRDLLTALPGIGPARASQLLAEIRIAESRRIQGLGPKQRVALLGRLGYPAESQA